MKYLPLIRLLVNRELTLRYKRSVIGIGWTLLNPVLTSAVLWYVFSFVFASSLPSGQQFAPYLVAGILLNTFFSQGLTQAADSIASSGGVLTKIYVPPQVFAISSALAGLTNFFIGIALIAANQGQELVTALSVVTCGATVGFLLWNKSPAKIYMGDAGALFLGVLVAVLTIRLNPGITPKFNSFAILPMLLAVPILDTCIAVFSRLRRGISPLTGGRDHLSHRLMRKGLSKHASAYLLWGMQASFVAIALVVYSYSTTLGTPGVVLAGAYWLGAFVWFWRIPSID